MSQEHNVLELNKFISLVERKHFDDPTVALHSDARVALTCNINYIVTLAMRVSSFSIGIFSHSVDDDRDGVDS